MNSPELETLDDAASLEVALIADPVAALDRAFVLPEGEELQEMAFEPEGAQDESFMTRMNFQVGDLELFCKQDDSREIVEPPVVERIPNTAAWFKGIANIRGSMTPIVDLGEALGNRTSNMKYAYLMLFGRGEDSFGLLVNALPRNEVVNTGRRLAKPPPLPDLLRDSVVAAYNHNNKICVDLNIQTLFKVLSENLRAW